MNGKSMLDPSNNSKMGVTTKNLINTNLDFGYKIRNLIPKNVDRN